MSGGKTNSRKYKTRKETGIVSILSRIEEVERLEPREVRRVNSSVFSKPEFNISFLLSFYNKLVYQKITQPDLDRSPVNQ
jgi:hypothetical protein